MPLQLGGIGEVSLFVNFVWPWDYRVHTSSIIIFVLTKNSRHGRNVWWCGGAVVVILKRRFYSSSVANQISKRFISYGVDRTESTLRHTALRNG